jgi:hypothetical protein
MKTAKLIRFVLFAAVFTVLGLVGCEKLDPYSIDAPSDLQSRIDSIANSKGSGVSGDTTFINIATAIVGADDNSSGWWSAFSDYFSIPTNKLLHLEFINYSTGANNWNNWNLAVTNEVADRDDSGYKEYFVLRSDSYGWGGKMAAEGYPFDLKMVKNNYPLNSSNEVDWDAFRTNMMGANVTIEVDHSATGNVYVTSTAVGSNGVEMVQTYEQAVSASANIVAFLICDGSHFKMNKAYLIPSKVTKVEDFAPVSISVSGTPAFVELGDDDYWGDGVATVTFADGSSAQVDTADIAFNVIPDMTTVGKKTVSIAYSKTKLGAYSKPVVGYYTLEVTNSVVGISANSIKYYYFTEGNLVFKPRGVVVTASYSDGTSAVLERNAYSLQYPATVASNAGSQDIAVTYVSPTQTFTTTCTATLVKGIAQVGNNDLATPWWTAFSDNYPVASGASKSITMYCYSKEGENWHSPCVILRKADNAEYGVMRMDNFGWGTGYEGIAVATSNWNWDTFKSNIHGSKIVVTVKNNGNNTADVRYDVTYASGETHFQNYAGVAVDSSDLNCALVIENAYVVITE